MECTSYFRSTRSIYWLYWIYGFIGLTERELPEEASGPALRLAALSVDLHPRFRCISITHVSRVRKSPFTSTIAFRLLVAFRIYAKGQNSPPRQLTSAQITQNYISYDQGARSLAPKLGNVSTLPFSRVLPIASQNEYLQTFR